MHADPSIAPDEGGHPHVVRLRAYLGVWIALLLLTCQNVAAS